MFQEATEKALLPPGKVGAGEADIVIYSFIRNPVLFNGNHSFITIFVAKLIATV